MSNQIRETYPRAVNYGKIAVSSKCHSEEQIINQVEASQRLVYKNNSYLFYGRQVHLYCPLVAC